MNNKLSVCVICKNEQDRLATCLSSLAFADEIVVLDSGSTDNTLEVARRFTGKVYVRDDWAGFGEQRRRAENLAANDWILMIDSDEVVSDQLALSIISSMETARPEQVFRLNRLTFFCGQFVRHSGWYPDRIARLYCRTRYRYNQNHMVHESLDCSDAELVDLQGDLLHFALTDLGAYLQKRMAYANTWAEDHFTRGDNASMIRAVSSAIFAFARHYFLRAGFLDGRVGFLIAAIQMQYTFNKYALLVMKSRMSNRGKS